MSDKQVSSRKERKRAKAINIPPAERNPRAAAAAVAAGKTPALGVRPAPSDAGHFTWRFNFIDHEGPWPVKGFDDDALQALLLKMSSFESMTYNELFSGDEPGKHYPLTALCADAQRRLELLKRDDEDRISRLRINGKQRLYGFVRERIFHVIWWDPEHEVCPSTLRNT